MTAANREALYKQIVGSKIKKTESDAAIPIDALRVYHDEAGFEENQFCTVFVDMPEACEGLYNYFIGENAAEDANVMVLRVLRYDPVKMEATEVPREKSLDEEVISEILDGGASINGKIGVDQNGRMLLSVAFDDDMMADVLVEFQPDKRGYTFYMFDDMSSITRVCRDGDIFRVSVVPVANGSGVCN